MPPLLSIGQSDFNKSTNQKDTIRGLRTQLTINKIAGRRGAPQASSDRRRHRNCFQTGPAQAFPKK